MIRVLLTAAGGYIVMAGLAFVVAGLPTKGQSVRSVTYHVFLSLIYIALCATVGGWAAALMAGQNPVGTALAVSAWALVRGITLPLPTSIPTPGWYRWVSFACIVIGVLLGGNLEALWVSRSVTNQ